jgi:hypothetical protein
MAYALTGQAGFAQMNNFKFHHRGTEDAEILIFMNGFDYIMFKSDRIYQSSLRFDPARRIIRIILNFTAGAKSAVRGSAMKEYYCEYTCFVPKR